MSFIDEVKKKKKAGKLKSPTFIISNYFTYNYIFLKITMS